MATRRREIVRALSLVAGVCAVVGAILAWDVSQQGEFSFKAPWFLLALLAGPLSFWTLFLRRRRHTATLDYSSTVLLARLKQGSVARLASSPQVFRVVALILVALALARPQTRERGGRVEVEGIDILLTLDLSNSMKEIDIAPNRLEAAKNVIDTFISRRRSDKMGLVVFGKEAYTHCPLTLDYSVLRTMLADIRLGLIDGAGTAIGNALGVSLARLRSSDAKSRVVILLTDGDSNSGNVTPTQAARYAQAMGVKVFTILMGAKEGEEIIRRDMFGRPVKVQQQFPTNPKLLQEIANQTGGKAYRATDREALEQNFESILNELDKSTRKDVAAVFLDAYRLFVALALFLLLVELGLSLTRLRQFP